MKIGKIFNDIKNFINDTDDVFDIKDDFIMTIIDKLFCKIFRTNGGFEFSNSHFNSVLKPYNGYKWYPIIHVYDNTWYLFIQFEYKSNGYQLSIWNHHKYWSCNLQDESELQEPNSSDYNTENIY